MATEHTRSQAGTPSGSAPSPGLICLAVAAAIFASRMWLLQFAGSAVPYWDEWDVYAVELQRPWLEGSLHLRDLLTAHNEHHLLFSRLTHLLIFTLNGRWEPWAELLVNAALHAFTGAGLLWLLWAPLSSMGRLLLAAIFTVVFVAPAGWQNALWGIQSQVYYSSLFSVAAIAGLLLAAPLSVRWWGGWLAAVLALYAFAGGVFASLAVLPVVACTSPKTWRSRRAAAGLMIVAVIPVVAFTLFREPPGQVPLHARNLAEYYAVISRSLSWPMVDSPVAWCLLQLPAAILLITQLRRGATSTARDRCAYALILFAVIQAVAIAHNRGAGLPEHRPLSRYQDPLLLGVAAQAYCVLRLAGIFQRPARLLALAWFAVLAFGLLALSTTNITFNLVYKRAQSAASLAQIRDYLARHDPAVFTRDPPLLGPHPNPHVVQAVLDDPLLRPALPSIFYTNDAETAPGRRPWLVANGRSLFVACITVLVAALLWRRKRRPAASQTETSPAVT